MRSIDIEGGIGVYAGGRFLRVCWMADGRPICAAPSLLLAATAAEEVAQQIAINRAVVVIATEAEAIEAASRLASAPAPSETIIVADDTGDVREAPNGDFRVWTEAVQALAAIAERSGLQHLLRTRADALRVDELGRREPAWCLDLPPVPQLDPLTETADWDGHAWKVRPLSPSEVAIWPLRPAPVPATVSGTQLRVALHQQGLLSMVEAAVASAGGEAAIRWGAAVMERDSELLNALAAGMGLSSADIDDIFRAAART